MAVSAAASPVVLHAWPDGAASRSSIAAFLSAVMSPSICCFILPAISSLYCASVFGAGPHAAKARAARVVTARFMGAPLRGRSQRVDEVEQRLPLGGGKSFEGLDRGVRLGAVALVGPH